MHAEGFSGVARRRELSRLILRDTRLRGLSDVG
jgi:hypothetical protein